MIMNLGAEQKVVLNHDDIANLARQIWQSEGSQPGRDLEYWLQAERQILTVRRLGKKQPKTAGAKRPAASASRKKSVSQPAASVGFGIPSR